MIDRKNVLEKKISKTFFVGFVVGMIYHVLHRFIVYLHLSQMRMLL